MKKRIISSLLALSMVVSQLPLTAMAEESIEKSTTEVSWGISADSLTESGTFQQAVEPAYSIYLHILGSRQGTAVRS